LDARLHIPDGFCLICVPSDRVSLAQIQDDHEARNGQRGLERGLVYWSWEPGVVLRHPAPQGSGPVGR